MQMLDDLELMSPEEWASQPGALFGPGSVEGKARILALTPAHPTYGIMPQTWQSIRAAIMAYDGPIDWIITHGDNPHAIKNDNIVYHHNRARQMVLEGNYDALLSIEADMIVPPDTVQRLLETGADVSYGLYVWRHWPERWSAYTDVELFSGYSLALRPDLARKHWGKIITVKGLGMGCTLIRRNVLAALEFRLYEGNPDDWLVQEYGEHMRANGIDPERPRRTMFCDDWMLALEAERGGFSQRAHLGVACGHIGNDGVYWPDPNEPNLYRTTSLEEGPFIRQAAEPMGAATQ